MTTIKFSISENTNVEVWSPYLQKCEILSTKRKFSYLRFFLLPKKWSIFFMGDCIKPIALKDWNRAHSKRNLKF